MNLLDRIYRKSRLFADSARGLDFENVLYEGDTGVDPRYSHRSSPSGNKFLKAALDWLEINDRHSIIDVGSGKGSAMRVMSRYPFSRISGIEISPIVANIARRNFLRIGDPRIDVIEMDATIFSNWNIYSHFYFYNPFPEVVMKCVMEGMARSLPAGRRLIYCNPVCHDVVISTGRFDCIREFPGAFENPIYVYESK